MSDDRDLDASGPLAQRYRALGAEEPPRALDAAILAAARRSVRPWTKRWAVPLSLAAVVVLSVAVTLRIQYEQPDTDAPAPPAKEIAAAVKESAPTQKETVPAAKSAARKEPSPFPSALRDQAPVDKPAAETSAAAPPAAPAASAPAGAKRLMAREEMRAETPERELERIALLRGEGKHDEADKALAEFRKRRPDYRIPEAMLERVERR